MITKTAVTAWKLMMPSLKRADIERLKLIRKPIEEYNAGVARGIRNRSAKEGIDIDMVTPEKNPLLTKAFIAERKKHAQGHAIGASIHYGKDFLQRRGVSNRAIAEELSRSGAMLGRDKPLIFAYVDPHSRNPLINEFHKNNVAKHELLETIDRYRYYKKNPFLMDSSMPYSTYRPTGSDTLKGKVPARPIIPRLNEEGELREAFSHNTMNVLRDEYKDQLRSGFYDLSKNKELGVVGLRTYTGEKAALDALGEKFGTSAGGIVGVNDAGKKTVGATKKAQKRFFRNITGAQKKYDRFMKPEYDESGALIRPAYIIDPKGLLDNVEAASHISRAI